MDVSSLGSELRTLRTSKCDDATVDVLGMCLYASPLSAYQPNSFNLAVFMLHRLCYIHIGVGFEVAYLFGRQVRRPGIRDKQQGTDLTLLLFCVALSKT